MIIAALYIIVFSFIILKVNFFEDDVVSRKWILISFAAKLIAGFALTYIYTAYYTDRNTADIFKYYDDSKIIYKAAFESPLDYLKMITGIGNDNQHFNETYYAHMNHWTRRFDTLMYNDNHTIIRFNAIVMLFSFGSFHVHTVFMCFLSLIGLAALYKAFKRFFKGKELLSFLLICFSPSVLLWGSGVLKEGLLFLALGFLFYGFFRFTHKEGNALKNLLLVALAIFLLLVNKYYLLVVLFPSLIAYFIVEKIQVKKLSLVTYLICNFGLIVLGITISNQIKEKSILESFVMKQHDFINVAEGGVFLQNDYNFVRIAPENKKFLDTIDANSSPQQFRIKANSYYYYWRTPYLDDTLYIKNSLDTAQYHLVWDLPKAGSIIRIKKLEANYTSFIKVAPQAIYNCLTKPLNIKGSMFEKIASLENIMILGFLILCIFLAKLNQIKTNVLWLCVFSVLFLFLIIGYTTPVAGAIVRYKAPLLPLLLLIGLNLLNPDWLKKLPFNKVK